MKNFMAAALIVIVIASGTAYVLSVRETAAYADANARIDRAIDADVRCCERCAAAGWGSLNAFYSPRFARCMCQDINPHGHIYNDFEGYRILRQGDLPQ